MTNPSPGHEPGDPHRAPATQAMVSAALLLPTIVAFFVRSTVSYQLDAGEYSLFRADVWNVALTALTDVYFIVVVAVRARAAATRVSAALLAMAATILDVATLALIYYTDYDLVLQWIGNTGSAIALVLFVASWGVARRQRPSWLLGLVPALVIATVITLAYQLNWAAAVLGARLFTWYVGWALWIGAFVLGCLCCWVFDARSRARAGEPRPTTRPLPAPVDLDHTR